MMKGLRRKDWLETEGTVTNVFNDSGRRGRETSVVFTYKVDGHWYSGSFEPFTGGYKEGDAIAVRYDPADPNRNNYTVGDHWRRLIYWAIGIVVVIAIILAVLN